MADANGSASQRRVVEDLTDDHDYDTTEDHFQYILNDKDTHRTENQNSSSCQRGGGGGEPSMLISSTQPLQGFQFTQSFCTQFDRDSVYEEIYFHRYVYDASAIHCHDQQKNKKQSSDLPSFATMKVSLKRVVKEISFNELQERLMKKLFPPNARPDRLILRWRSTGLSKEKNLPFISILYEGLNDMEDNPEILKEMLKYCHESKNPIEIYAVEESAKMAINVDIASTNIPAGKKVSLVLLVNQYETSDRFKEKVINEWLSLQSSSKKSHGRTQHSPKECR
jgi:hypothetical protein